MNGSMFDNVPERANSLTDVVMVDFLRGHSISGLILPRYYGRECNLKDYLEREILGKHESKKRVIYDREFNCVCVTYDSQNGELVVLYMTYETPYFEQVYVRQLHYSRELTNNLVKVYSVPFSYAMLYNDVVLKVMNKV